MPRERTPRPFLVLAAATTLAMYIGAGVLLVWMLDRRPAPAVEPAPVRVVKPPAPRPEKVVLGRWRASQPPGLFGDRLTIYRDEEGRLWLAHRETDEKRLALTEGKTPDGRPRYHIATRGGVSLEEDDHFRIVNGDLTIWNNEGFIDVPACRYRASPNP